MRKIDPHDFKLATRGTSRDINRQIVLTLIRTHQPVSRADLARLMDTNRANITLLVNELLGEKLVREVAGDTQKSRGRRPTFLYINSDKGAVIALDVRASRTFLMITDSIGNQLGDVISFPTKFEPAEFVADLGRRARKALADVAGKSTCDGIGVVIPGMVNPKSGMIINAPALGWKNLNLISLLRTEFGDTEIHLENSGKACALSQIWSVRRELSGTNDIVFVSVSDGLGVGIVINGEVLRGRHNTAGEFGHVPLSIDGPKCACGANGCLEAYISNPVTLSRYLGTNVAARQPKSLDVADFTIDDLVARARRGDAKALAALNSTARYLGMGLGLIVNAIDPSVIYIGGEITDAWDLIGHGVREALRERVLTPDLGDVRISIVPASEHPRLRGAVALITAPAFAAPKVA